MVAGHQRMVVGHFSLVAHHHALVAGHYPLVVENHRLMRLHQAVVARHPRVVADTFSVVIGPQAGKMALPSFPAFYATSPLRRCARKPKREPVFSQKKMCAAGNP